MIRAILFDLDGTLVDSLDDLLTAANRLLAERDLPPLDRATLRLFVGRGMVNLVERCLGHYDRAADPAAVARFKRIYDEGDFAATHLFDGVAEALGALRQRGYRLGVCTNKDSAPARRILDNLGIIGQFSAVIGGDSLPAVKPDPRLLIAAADLCGAGLDEVLLVGDSEIDAAAGRRAGVPLLLYEGGYRHSTIAALAPAACFADFAALPGLVEQLRRTIG